MKCAFQLFVLKRNRPHGLRARMVNKSGRWALARRCAKGRSRLTISKQ